MFNCYRMYLISFVNDIYIDAALFMTNKCGHINWQLLNNNSELMCKYMKTVCASFK